MIISEKKKYCFIAPPKTGTTTITQLLIGDGDVLRDRVPQGDTEVVVSGHATAREVAELMGEERWSNLYSFAFVRNPWDRVVSAYSYYRNGRVATGVMKLEDRRLHMVLKVLSAKLLPFNLWVWLYQPLSYADYVTDNKGKVIVSKVYRFEEYAVAYKDICERLNIPEPQLKKANTSKHKDYRQYYNKVSIRLVGRRCRSDVELFGYTFEGT